MDRWVDLNELEDDDPDLLENPYKSFADRLYEKAFETTKGDSRGPEDD